MPYTKRHYHNVYMLVFVHCQENKRVHITYTQTHKQNVSVLEKGVFDNNNLILTLK